MLHLLFTLFWAQAVLLRCIIIVWFEIDQFENGDKRTENVNMQYNNLLSS